MEASNHQIKVRIHKGETEARSYKGASNESESIEKPSAGELLAMSLATCLNSTLKVVLLAHQQDINYEIEVIHASHRETNKHDGYYFSYEVHVMLYDISDTLGQKYVALTKKLCPVSKALRDHPHYQTIIHYKKSSKS
jgi:uncharacterized OsmC-like protein